MFCAVKDQGLLNKKSLTQIGSFTLDLGNFAAKSKLNLIRKLQQILKIRHNFLYPDTGADPRLSLVNRNPYLPLEPTAQSQMFAQMSQGSQLMAGNNPAMLNSQASVIDMSPFPVSSSVVHLQSSKLIKDEFTPK